MSDPKSDTDRIGGTTADDKDSGDAEETAEASSSTSSTSSTYEQRLAQQVNQSYPTYVVGGLISGDVTDLRRFDRKGDLTVYELPEEPEERSLSRESSASDRSTKQAATPTLATRAELHVEEAPKLETAHLEPARDPLELLGETQRPEMMDLPGPKSPTTLGKDDGSNLVDLGKPNITDPKSIISGWKGPDGGNLGDQDPIGNLQAKVGGVSHTADFDPHGSALGYVDLSKGGHEDAGSSRPQGDVELAPGMGPAGDDLLMQKKDDDAGFFSSLWKKLVGGAGGDPPSPSNEYGDTTEVGKQNTDSSWNLGKWVTNLFSTSSDQLAGGGGTTGQPNNQSQVSGATKIDPKQAQKWKWELEQKNAYMPNPMDDGSDTIPPDVAAGMVEARIWANKTPSSPPGEGGTGGTPQLIVKDDPVRDPAPDEGQGQYVDKAELDNLLSSQYWSDKTPSNIPGEGGGGPPTVGPGGGGPPLTAELESETAVKPEGIEGLEAVEAVGTETAVKFEFDPPVAINYETGQVVGAVPSLGAVGESEPGRAVEAQAIVSPSVGSGDLQEAEPLPGTGSLEHVALPGHGVTGQQIEDVSATIAVGAALRGAEEVSSPLAVQAEAEALALLHTQAGLAEQPAAFGGLDSGQPQLEGSDSGQPQLEGSDSGQPTEMSGPLGAPGGEG
jgi:hypothetical protein